MLNVNKTAMVGIILTFISVVIALFAWLIPVNGNNSGVDPETHAKVLAEKILMERQLAQAKQVKITSGNILHFMTKQAHSLTITNTYLVDETIKIKYNLYSLTNYSIFAIINYGMANNNFKQSC